MFFPAVGFFLTNRRFGHTLWINLQQRTHRDRTTTISGEPASSFDLEDPIKVEMEYSVFKPGSFTVGVAVSTMKPGLQAAFFERDALMFQVTENIQATVDTKRMGYAGPMPGTLRPSLPWTVETVGSPEVVAR